MKCRYASRIKEVVTTFKKDILIEKSERLAVKTLLIATGIVGRLKYKLGMHQ